MVAEVDGNKLTIDFDKAGRKRVVDSFVARADTGVTAAALARGHIVVHYLDGRRRKALEAKCNFSQCGSHQMSPPLEPPAAEHCEEACPEGDVQPWQ